MSRLPSDWSTRPLGEVATLQRGFDLPVQDRIPGEHPVFAANGPVGTHNVAKVKGPGVVTGRSGTLGSVHYVETDYWPLNTALWVKDFHGNEPRWIARLLRWMRLDSHTRGTGVPTLNRNLVHVVPVPVPPLHEQRRIADILDKADAIRRKRQQAIHLTEDLLRSTFLDMVSVGHPDYVSWERRQLQELAATHKGAMRTGPFGSALRHSEFVDSGVAVLGIDNAVQNRFAWGERRYISEGKYEGLRRYTVCPGDVIVTIMGTIGRTAVVPNTIQTAITTKHLATITLDPRRAKPEFVAHAMRLDPAVLSQIGSRSRGAIMSGLNLGIIRTLELSVPPLSHQRRFTDAVASLRGTSYMLVKAASEADVLFGSLVQRAFRGEM